MKLADKIALITGAGSGFGRATAILFGKEGAKIAVVDIAEKTGQETVKQIQQQGGQAMFINADVSKAGDAEGMVKKTVDTFGKIDILYNNAGIPMSFTPVETITEQLWDRIQAVNVKGIFLGAKYAVPHMKKQGGGVILNTSSISGVRPRPGLSAYSTAKAAAMMLTRALAIELAPFKIRANCINPGPAETPMLAKFMSDQALPKEKYEEGKKRFLDTVPLGRFIRVEDIAHAALYLASDEASLVTGVCLDVDGGRGI